MKNFNLSCGPLSVCIAAISLAACGGNSGTISQGNEQSNSSYILPLAQQPVYVRKPGAFSGETFVGKRIHAVCHFNSQELQTTIDFRIKGEATGPFPGMFTARGEASTGLCCTTFREHLKVTSGSQTISGVAQLVKLIEMDCNKPGFRLKASYTLNGQFGSGQTSVTVRPRKFTQTFD